MVNVLTKYWELTRTVSWKSESLLVMFVSFVVERLGKRFLARVGVCVCVCVCVCVSIDRSVTSLIRVLPHGDFCVCTLHAFRAITGSCCAVLSV
jgi:hypothetical protein